TPVPRRQLLLLRQWLLRPRPGAASAADGTLSKRGFDGFRLTGEFVKRLRNSCTGPRPVHFFLRGAAAIGLAVAPLSLAHAAPAPARPIQVGQSIDDFYRARSAAPLWFAPAAGDAAEQLVSLLGTASLDGLDPDKYHAASLQQALEAARGGKRKEVEAADRALSEAFVAYVSDLRRDPGLGIIYVDAALRPAPPSPLALLLGAASAPSLSAYVRDFGWMNPLYGELRHALSGHAYSNDHERQLLTVNLERARALPAGKQRYIVVNAAQQRLYAFEDGKQVDTMVVVVGKPKYPTPMITAYVRFASLNPYWFVPPDLAAERIAPKVLKQGLGYLDDLG